MSWFDHGETRVYYEESGIGAAVLLLPGWGGTIAELEPLRAALTPSYRVIAADLPGSGKSGPRPRTYTPAYYQEDALVFLALLEALNASPAHLVGFSDGGECELLMAALQPAAVQSVVTWGAAGSVGSNLTMADAMFHIIDSPIPPMHAFSAYLKDYYGEANARVMTQSFGKTLKALMETGGDISRSRAARIACPVLLITGTQDILATPALVSDMARAIPNAEFVEARGAGHPVHHEQPAWLVETVVTWLAKH